MYNPLSTLTMIAFLSLNLVSAFVCQAAIPLPTSFFLQKYKSPPSSRHIPTKDRTALLHRSTILQQHRINGDIFSSNSSLMIRGGGSALSSSTTNDEKNKILPKFSPVVCVCVESKIELAGL